MFVPIFKEFLTLLRRIFKERFWKDGMLKLREKRRKVVEQNGTYIIRQTYIKSRCKSEELFDISDLFNHSKKYARIEVIRSSEHTALKVLVISFLRRSLSNFRPSTFLSCSFPLILSVSSFHSTYPYYRRDYF